MKNNIFSYSQTSEVKILKLVQHNLPFTVSLCWAGLCCAAKFKAAHAAEVKARKEEEKRAAAEEQARLERLAAEKKAGQ